MRYAVIYRGGSYRIHRADCSDVKKDRAGATTSWTSDFDIDVIISNEIETLADDGIEIEEADFRVLPCAREAR